MAGPRSEPSAGLAKSGVMLPLGSAMETCMALSLCMDWKTTEPSAVTVLSRGERPVVAVHLLPASVLRRAEVTLVFEFADQVKVTLNVQNCLGGAIGKQYLQRKLFPRVFLFRQDSDRLALQLDIEVGRPALQRMP